MFGWFDRFGKKKLKTKFYYTCPKCSTKITEENQGNYTLDCVLLEDNTYGFICPKCYNEWMRTNFPLLMLVREDNE